MLQGKPVYLYNIYGTTNVLGLLLVSTVLSLNKLPHYSLEAGEALAPLVLLLELADLVRVGLGLGFEGSADLRFTWGWLWARVKAVG